MKRNNILHQLSLFNTDCTIQAQLTVAAQTKFIKHIKLENKITLEEYTAYSNTACIPCIMYATQHTHMYAWTHTHMHTHTHTHTRARAHME